jgi:tetratricopeptide (TPR) repeat protein
VRNLISIVLLVSAMLALAGCDSVEERAEGHYQNALALIDEGDIDRAIVELRNVFELNGNHRDARLTMAELQLEQGNRPGAYRQYLRLAEQDPDDLQTRIILSEMAFLALNWEEVDRHGARLEDLDPENARVQAITLARAYREAINGNATAVLRDLGRQADEMLTDQPENPVLRSILIDYTIREGEFIRALAEVDWMIAHDPTNSLSYQERLRLLAQIGDMAGVEAQLREMVDIFPDDPTHKRTLVQFYLSRNNLDAAEEFLRELATKAKPDDTAPALDLIRFLVELRGVDVAKAEIERIIADYSDPVPFLTVSAGLDFTQGQRDTAIETLENILNGAEPSGQIRDIRVTLARMLLATGNEAGARARVEEVLAEDESHPGALKMLAAWQIQADETDAAISGLRVALDQAPEDAEAMTLMADAYARVGQTELTKDFLARAVQASGNAPSETLRLARFLMAEESYLPAEDILLSALRIAPSNIDILNALGELYLRMDDFGRAQSVADALRRNDGDIARQSANRIEAERLNKQRGVDEALAFLESIASSEDATLAARIDLVRAHLNVGDPTSALALAQELSQEFPDNDALSLVLASAHASSGDLGTAISLYTQFLDENPTRSDIWLELSRLYQRQGNRDLAKSVINEGLDHSPSAVDLLWANASFLEQDGNIDAAITIYERLYTQDSSSLVIANNLASLLTTYRDDDASLERAWTIARRLRNTESAPLQDTYGWLLHRRGDSAEALAYLEAAAEGLPNDPLVQYHLGQVYIALDRRDDALTQFRKAVQIASPVDRRPQIEEARALIQSLQSTEALEN